MLLEKLVVLHIFAFGHISPITWTSNLFSPFPYWLGPFVPHYYTDSSYSPKPTTQYVTQPAHVQIPQYVCGRNLNARLFNDQKWYLTKMGILDVWEKCITGQGVRVAVVDNGVANLQDISIDAVQHYDADPGTAQTNSHGTQEASMIAAHADSQCGIGIAFESTIIDHRVISSRDIDDTRTAEGLKRSLSSVDIYSNAYDYFADGFTIYPLSNAYRSALEYGTTKGRGGRGAVYVWGTGNDGDTFISDSCAYDGLMNNRYVIPVAGIQANHDPLPGGEQCSSIMVTAYTVNVLQPGNQRIVTTKADGTCSKQFGRNSAAVGMVSGILALLLQKKPDLGYRDVMHLLVRTSNAFSNTLFKTNGAGHKVSEAYGFGIINASRLTEMAENWRNVGSVKHCSQSYSTELHSPVLLGLSFTTCSIQRVEHVQVSLNIVSSYDLGHLNMDLISPARTKSNLLPGRNLDHRHNLNITVTSVAFWDESSRGIWKVDFQNFTSGILNHVTVNIYGTSISQSQYAVIG